MTSSPPAAAAAAGCLPIDAKHTHAQAHHQGRLLPQAGGAKLVNVVAVAGGLCVDVESSVWRAVPSQWLIMKVGSITGQVHALLTLADALQLVHHRIVRLLLLLQVQLALGRLLLVLCRGISRKQKQPASSLLAAGCRQQTDRPSRRRRHRPLMCLRAWRQASL